MSPPLKPALIVICGPTATGKSGLAIALAQQFNGIILSADSRQVYREFDIGTAKPTAAEREQVPHYLIDMCEPTETFTVAEFQELATELIARCHQGQVKRGKSNSPTAPTLPFLVGGTGLYIKSIVRGMKIPRVAPQPVLRSQLQNLGQAQCYAMLQQVDAAAAAKIHPNDPVRTLRALEVVYVTGQPMSEQQGEAPPDYPILQLGLDCQDSDEPNHDPLTRRIAKRTDQMLEMGFVEEVKSLCDRYGEYLPLLNTLGYQEIRSYLSGEISLVEARSQTILHTRQFAKRQRTWFRADPSIAWLDADAPDLLAVATQHIDRFLDDLPSI
jgi:tRNA dimethylallyltransferase